MPFTAETASTAGKLGGSASAKVRWADKNPEEKRNQPIYISVTKQEMAEIDEKAKNKGMSRTELIIKAVQKMR